MGEMVKGEQSAQPNQSALGRMLGLSPAAITKLKKQGMPVHSATAAQAWRMEKQSVARRKRESQQTAKLESEMHHIATPMGEGAYANPVPSYNESRARREAAEANLAELKLAQERGELVLAVDVRQAMAKRAAGLRESLLQLPARVVPLLAANPDPGAMDQVLRAEIVAALSQLVVEVQ